MRRVQKLLGSGTAVLLVTGLIAAPGSTAADTSATNCARATNIEAIVDDSGSMEISDGGRLRVQGLNLLIGTLKPSTQLGAVEFGSELLERPAAETLFPPLPIGPNAAAMRTALDQRIHADNGATDYNAAFAKADADNPNANAKIFLTDGGHIVGAYNEAHLAHNVPTYVVGLDVSSGEDQARLEKIARDTRGKYFPLEDSSQLQSVMNSVGAALTCQTPPRQFVDTLGQGQSKSHNVTIGAATKVVQITLTWSSPLDKFKLTGLRLTGKKGFVAVAPRRRPPAKLKVKTTNSTTFTVLKVSNLRQGTLRFKVKATKVASGAPKATLTTQVGQSSRK